MNKINEEVDTLTHVSVSDIVQQTLFSLEQEVKDQMPLFLTLKRNGQRRRQKNLFKLDQDGPNKIKMDLLRSIFET